MDTLNGFSTILLLYYTPTRIKKGSTLEYTFQTEAKNKCTKGLFNENELSICFKGKYGHFAFILVTHFFISYSKMRSHTVSVVSVNRYYCLSNHRQQVTFVHVSHISQLSFSINLNRTSIGRVGPVTKTRIYNFDPLKPHFYIMKLGSIGVYIIFLISAKNIDCGYSSTLNL